MKKFSSFIAIMLLSFYSAMAQTTATINTEINLITSVDQFSSPYTESREGSVEALFDNDPSTFWHSVWSSGSVDNGVHYFQIEVASLPNEFAFSFTRRGVSNDQISRWSVYGVPENNTDATKMKCALLAEVETPVGSSGETCISPVISSQGFTTIRFYEEATSENRGYFHLAEFAIHPVETPEISPLANSVYTTQLESQTGKQMVLPIQMKNTIEATGFQADLVLPEGITVAEDEDGLPLVALSTERTTPAKTNVFDCDYQADGSLRILCNSTKGIAFTGNDGEVALVTLNISEEMTAGDYPIILKNIVITDAQGTNKKKVEATESVLKIVSSTEEGGDSEPDSWECSHIHGDVNGDGEVTIEDVNEVIDILLKKKSAESTTPTEPVDPYNGHEYVDLGLPSGTLWATCNVGATSPAEDGDLYTWPNSAEAAATWGGKWEMMTKDDKDELVAYCSYSKEFLNGISGVRYTGPNGNSIFLPFTGYQSGSDVYKKGEGAQYWTSTPYEDGVCYWVLRTDSPVQEDNSAYYWPMYYFGHPLRLVLHNITK